MRIFVLIWLGLLINAYGGVWIPTSGQITPGGKIIFNLPFPVLNDPDLEEGFFSIPRLNPANFKRILAVAGKGSSPNLVEYLPGLFLPSENPTGYVVIEESNKILKGRTRKEPGFIAKRFSKTLQGAQSLPEIEEIPSKMEDFGKWRPGDSIAFRKTDELKVNAAYGAKTFFDYGVASTISADWDVLIRFPYIAENPEKKMLVFVSYSIPAGSKYFFDKGGFPENVNLFKLWGKSQTIKYLFDLSNTKTAPLLKIVHFEGNQKNQETLENVNALLAYQEALKGNLIPANLLSQLKIYGVRKIFEEEEEEKIKGQGPKSIKIPFEIDANFKKGSTLISGRGRAIPGNLFLENEAVYFVQDFSGLPKDSSSLKTFVGFLQQINNLGKIGGASYRRLSAILKSQFKYINIDREEYFRELKRDFLAVGFPESSLIPNTPKDKVGDLEILLDVSLSNVALDVLMNLPDEYPENVLVNQANDNLTEFFRNKVDGNYEICEYYGEKDLNKCIFISKKRTFAAMTGAYKALKEMKQKRNERNYEEFLRAFGEFGKTFAENRFSLVTFLRFIGHNFQATLQGEEKFRDERIITVDGRPSLAPFEIKIQIQGPNINPYTKVLRNTLRKQNN